MQNQITSEVHADELFVVETEERLETVQVVAVTTYFPCLMGVDPDDKG